MFTEGTVDGAIRLLLLFRLLRWLRGRRRRGRWEIDEVHVGLRILTLIGREDVVECGVWYVVQLPEIINRFTPSVRQPLLHVSSPFTLRLEDFESALRNPWSWAQASEKYLCLSAGSMLKSWTVELRALSLIPWSQS
jgi:hypothetical protein